MSFPHNAATFALAEAALDDGDVDRALRVYRALLARENSPAPEDYAVAMGAAICHARKRSWPQAEAALAGIVARYPDSGMAHAYLGAARFETGQFEAALADLDTAIRLTPEEAIVWIKRAEVRLRLGSLQGALDDLAEAAKHPMPDTATRDYVRRLLVKTRHDVATSLPRPIPVPRPFWRRRGRGEPAPATPVAGTLAWREP